MYVILLKRHSNLQNITIIKYLALITLVPALGYDGICSVQWVRLSESQQEAPLIAAKIPAAIMAGCSGSRIPTEKSAVTGNSNTDV